MPKFIEIEGLRAYLAWSVVISHCLWLTGFHNLPLAHELLRLGELAALTALFSIVSYAVIEKPMIIYASKLNSP